MLYIMGALMSSASNSENSLDLSKVKKMLLEMAQIDLRLTLANLNDSKYYVLEYDDQFKEKDVNGETQVKLTCKMNCRFKSN